MTETRFSLLYRFRWSWPELVKISKSLRRIGCKECNYGLTERDEKRRQRLEEKAYEIAARFSLGCYFQRNPRGCALYLVTKKCREYTDGIAVY